MPLTPVLCSVPHLTNLHRLLPKSSPTRYLDKMRAEPNNLPAVIAALEAAMTGKLDSIAELLHRSDVSLRHISLSFVTEGYAAHELIGLPDLTIDQLDNIHFLLTGSLDVWRRHVRDKRYMMEEVRDALASLGLKGIL